MFFIVVFGCSHQPAAKLWHKILRIRAIFGTSPQRGQDHRPFLKIRPSLLENKRPPNDYTDNKSDDELLGGIRMDASEEGEGAAAAK